jgi:hypothetical protein
MIQSNGRFFSSGEKRQKDMCPVCKAYLGAAYYKTERIYDCGECDLIWIFHPNESNPVHAKRKSIDIVLRPVNPSWEDVEERQSPPDD